MLVDPSVQISAMVCGGGLNVEPQRVWQWSGVEEIGMVMPLKVRWSSGAVGMIVSGSGVSVWEYKEFRWMNISDALRVRMVSWNPEVPKLRGGGLSVAMSRFAWSNFE
jgi:hypothetical protein